MNDSFKFLTSMSPAIVPNAKRRLLKNRVPRKLALKKNVRRSSLLDGLPSTLQNNSLVIVDSSIEGIESPIVPKIGVTVPSCTDFGNQLSITRYAEITAWITEVNLANNIENEDKRDPVRMYVTERKKCTDFQIERDFSRISLTSDKHSRNSYNSSKLSKNETCVIISSSGSRQSFKSAHDDVIVIESSFNEDSIFAIDKIDFVRSEPRKKRQGVSFKEPPKTEGKVLQIKPQNNSGLSWLQRLKELCDSDTTESSIKLDKESFQKSSIEHPKNNEKNREPIKNPIRKKLNFNDLIDGLSNKENYNTLNKNFKLNKKTKDLDEPQTNNLKTKLKDQSSMCDTYSQCDGFLKRVDDAIPSKNKKPNKINEIDSENYTTSYREKKSSNFSSDEETLQRLIVKKPSLLKNTIQDCLKLNNDDFLLKKSNDDKRCSDISSDYESLADRLCKKDLNFDKILKRKTLTDKNVHESLTRKEMPKTAPTRKLKKKKRISKTSRNSTLVAQNEPKSFLGSLSGCVKSSLCHPSARIFRNNFQSCKNQLTTKLFKMYNEAVFDNAIPDDSPIEWSDRMRGTAGYCYCRKIVRSTGLIEKKIRIVLSTKVLDSADRLRDTLIHELCHAATWIVNGVANGHGDQWKAWTVRARQVFPELPPIKRCHDYVISTKYTYRCINCGYSFGRHSKSLDLNTKRCGYCLSKFELLINKKSKDGEVKSVPVTPKKEPTGFALFVKENYGLVKTPQLNHGQVMKLLGQKFNELKV